LGISSILTYLLIWMDTLFLGYFRSSEDVGLYSVALRIIIVAAIVQTSFNTMFAPLISEYFVRGELKQLEGMFKRITRWIFSLSLPLFLPILLFSSMVLEIFGNRFTVVSTSLCVLAIGQLVNASTGPVGGMISMSGRSGLELINSASIWVIGIVLCLILIPRWGIMGAAIANASAATLVNVCRAAEVYLLFRIQAYGREYLKPLAAAIVSGLITYAGFWYFHDARELWMLAVWVTAFWTIYFGIFFLLGLDEQDREMVRIMKMRF
jgi:O-antigen/teichoic acid export membrane protein